MADSDVAFSAGLILLVRSVVVFIVFKGFLSVGDIIIVSPRTFQVVLIELCRYFYYKTGLPKTTVTYEEFVSNVKKEGRNDMSHSEW